MSPPSTRFARLTEPLRRLRDEDPQRFAWLIGLGLLLTALTAFLLLAEKPWNSGLAEAIALGKHPKPTDYVVTGAWWAALANAVVLGAALASHRRWLETGPAPVSEDLAPPARRPSRLWLGLVAGAVLAGGLLAYPRLDHSLWTDEIFSVRRAIDGYWKPAEDGGLAFRGTRWTDTFWYYRNPNNHIPFSLLARSSLSLWQQRHGEGGLRFGEAWLRLPAFVAGAGSIAATGWLLWRLGFPAAGALAAWLLAIHPWHVRYASEARGYSLVLLLVAALVVALVAALYRGSWGRWIAYGLCQTLLLWTYPLMGALVAVVNLGALAALFQLHGRAAVGNGQLQRWVVANLACVMLLVQLFAPLVPQILEYVASQQHGDTVGALFVRNVASHLYLGVPWRVTRLADQPYAQLYDVELGGTPLPLVMGAVVAVLGLLAGVVRLWRCGGVRRTLALVLLLPGPLTWLLARLAGMFLWEWYLLFMLPAWGALVVLGLSWPLAARGRMAAGAAAVGLASLAAAFAVASEPAREALRRHPIQPRRDSVALTRPDLDPLAASQARVLTASFHVEPSLYDPHVQIVRNPAELRALMDRADREGLPLFVNVGWVQAADKRAPGMMDFVGQEALFERVAVLPGLKPRFTRHVYRYRGEGSGAG